MTDSKYITAISLFTYFGPARIKLLVSYFGTAKKVWGASGESLLETGIRKNKIDEFISFRNKFDIGDYYKNVNNKGIDIVTYLDSTFPNSLKEQGNYPVVLYYKGNLNCLSRSSVAIVGSRKMTSYGREVAEMFAGELGGMGITIVSGLARGIDTAAHKGALLVGGTTAAVLGGGIDNIYPPENVGLANEIIKRNGVIVSEYPPGSPSLPVNFAVRNRIISGLSSCVVVVEGEEKSGTLLTASHAADQGKTVFAVPGNITSPLSGAPLFLLKNGAKIATTPKDVLEEMNIEIKVDSEKMNKIAPDNNGESKIIEILKYEPLYLDELVRISGEKTSVISARLTIMEMKGLVKNLGKGRYTKI